MKRLSWLARESFIAIAESRPRNVRQWQHYGFDVDPDSIYSEIPVPYAENPDEDSFPSSVRRWYGQIDDRLFIVDLFFSSYPHECHVQIPFSAAHKFAWQTLLDLCLLPTSIRTNQPVYISNDCSSRVRTVFRHDERGFFVPIYDGDSDGDAESLIHFLRSQDSSIVYSLGEPELDIDWVAIELVGDSRILRARYNSRTDTLEFGCRMSKKSGSEYIVYSESPDVDARQYSIRDGIVHGVSHGR